MQNYLYKLEYREEEFKLRSAPLGKVIVARVNDDGVQSIGVLITYGALQRREQGVANHALSGSNNREG